MIDTGIEATQCMTNLRRQPRIGLNDETIISVISVASPNLESTRVNPHQKIVKIIVLMKNINNIYYLLIQHPSQLISAGRYNEKLTPKYSHVGPVIELVQDDNKLIVLGCHKRNRKITLFFYST